MGRYQAYPEYTESGEPWLGKIPSGWTVVPLKRVATLKTGLTPPTENQDNYEDDETEFSWVRPEDLNENGQAVNASKFLSASGWSLMRHIPAFSTLVCCIGTIGKLGYVERIVTTNQQITAASFTYAPKFNFYLLQSARKILEQTATGNVIQILNSERLSNVKFLFLPKEEAETIANFLDHETAKIDTLIEKQQQLIQLLKEKRQAVISHVVTKGLNSNAPMKDSGVEWLGEVPEHWGIGKIKNLSLVISKGTTPSTMGAEFESSGIRFLKAENIGKGFYAASQPEFYISKQTDEQLARSRLKDKDVLVIIAGATTGQASLITEELLPANTNQAVSFIRPLNSIYSEYISYWLSTEYSQSNIWQNAVQAAQPNLSMETLGNIYIPIPPEKEVGSLILEIQKQLLRFANVIENAEQAILFMQERRTALISAAVTGKIDVRNWQAPEAKTQAVAL